MPCAAVTVTVAVALPKFGVVAVMVAEPCAPPDTATLTLLAPTGKLTLAGTAATPGLLEVKLAVSPKGAAPDRFNVRFPPEPAPSVRVAGKKKLLPPLDTTCTCPFPDV